MNIVIIILNSITLIILLGFSINFLVKKLQLKRNSKSNKKKRRDKFLIELNKGYNFLKWAEKSMNRKGRKIFYKQLINGKIESLKIFNNLRKSFKEL